MKNKIEKLITELLDDTIAPGEKLSSGVSFDSSKTVAFKAKKKIDKLDSKYVPILKEIIVLEKNKNRKSEAYSILTNIAKRTNDSEIVDFLLNQLQTEKGKSFIGLKLMGFYWTDVRLMNNVNIVLDFAKEKNSLIKHSAIQLLSLFDSDRNKIEKFLLQILEESKDTYDIYYAHITLQTIGTKKSVEFLKRSIISSKKSDNLITGIYALGFIDGENQVDFFLELLSSKKDNFVKSTITEFITKHSDERAIDTMIDRIKQILSRKRTRNIHYGNEQKPEIIYILHYLNKYENIDLKIMKLKKWIVDRKMDFLDETETKMIRNVIKAGNKV